MSARFLLCRWFCALATTIDTAFDVCTATGASRGNVGFIERIGTIAILVIFKDIIIIRRPGDL